MPNAKKTLPLVSCCIVLFTYCFGNSLRQEDATEVSILYHDANFNDNFMLSPVPPF